MQGKSKALTFATAIVSLCGAPVLATTLTTLSSFNADLARPRREPVFDALGNIFGVAQNGGPANAGSVFKYSPSGVLSTLADFNPPTDGALPTSLDVGADGNYYGATMNPVGSTSSLFRVTPTGTISSVTPINGTLRSYMTDGVISDRAGNLYGVEGNGGSTNQGSIFKLTPSLDLTTLFSFNGSNGVYPTAAPTLDVSGNLYGTTSRYGDGAGGFISRGTVYRISAAGAFSTLYQFDGPHGTGPNARLTLGGDGNFYGTTTEGGANGFGTVFKITPSGVLTTLASFASQNPSSTTVTSRLTLDAAGNVFGTLKSGDFGSVFKLTPAGEYSTLVTFNGANGMGTRPSGGLVPDAAGNLYGFTQDGGTSDAGTLYQLSGTGFVVVPEPASLLALACAGGLILSRRRA